MSKNLVIVESPAKARTIEKYLGPDYEVLASYGHVRDLVPKEGAVDPEHGFAMKYQLIEKNEKHVDRIAKAVKKAGAVYLATDPDREGEAISWHVYEVLKDRKLLDSRPVHRVVFHEVTKRAIQDAIAHPRGLSEELINAQQARRALDYLVGFNLSPLLWKKVRRGLSAGRVQSPALRLIVEREDEIAAFRPQEYWTVEAAVAHETQAFRARLAVYLGDKVEQFTFTNESATREAERRIRERAHGVLTVAGIEKKQRRRNPAAPFTTSTLQQEASRKLGFSAQKTMTVAQRLYEGIDVGEGSTGLITYMRTDSVTLANEALTELRSVIARRYGPENLPEEARRYTTKARNAQEAHEAIRPTSAARAPEDVRRFLEHDQYRLYELIWKRTVASQMTPAVYDTVRVDLAAGTSVDGDIVFRATGSVLVSPGFIAVYQEGRDDNGAAEDQDSILPAVAEGDRLAMTDVLCEQHFTEPPPRYSEATLVKALEEYGIGRPSTYASIISTLRNREYVEMESRRFVPTDVGRVVNRFLTEHFSQYVDYEFTARMEDSLDAISRGEREWVPLLDEFWRPFRDLVEHTETSVTREQASQARVLGEDPKSGRPVSVRMGRYGAFVQIGTKDDEEKPLFAGLRPGQKMDVITLPEALELFKLPRELGETPDGEPVSANIGRFGPYVRYGNKFVSIRDDDPYTITLERALELIEEKKRADANRIINQFRDGAVQVLNGRYGPYVTDGTKNAKIPKGRDPAALTLEDCEELLAAAPERRSRRSKKTGAGAHRGARATEQGAAAEAGAAAPAAGKKKAAKKKPAKKKATKKKGTKKAARTKRSPSDGAPATRPEGASSMESASSVNGTPSAENAPPADSAPSETPTGEAEAAGARKVAAKKLSRTRGT
ncbi:MAG TPA: DNA topoisomerase I [Gammaproteobacteria bacterium]|nr:DNA topoisomerase I [Gammaproteobacteria bacterium]